MSGGRVSIAVVMKLTAIIALNLALPRAVPYLWVFQVPPFLFLIVVLDLALVQAVAFGRPLRTFYFTFLIVGIVSTSVVTALCSGNRARRGYRCTFWRPRSGVTRQPEGNVGHPAIHRVPDTRRG